MILEFVVICETEPTVFVWTLEVILECFLPHQKTFLSKFHTIFSKLYMSVIHSLNGQLSIIKVKVPFEFSMKGVPGKP